MFTIRDLPETDRKPVILHLTPTTGLIVLNQVLNALVMIVSIIFGQEVGRLASAMFVITVACVLAVIVLAAMLLGSMGWGW